MLHDIQSIFANTAIMSKTDYDVIISGGGMAGLTMALACARESLRVAVIEAGDLQAQHVPEFDGRVSAIAYGSKLMLDALGAWEGMKAYGEVILDIRVSDGDSPFYLDYHHQDIGDRPFGWIVENRYTRAALFQALSAQKEVNLFEHTRIQTYSANDASAEVTLDDGRVLHASLVIGAEGKNSKLRELAGIHAHKTNYAQTAIVCTIAHTEPHYGLAQERFLPRGPFAVLPMKDQRASLVWVEPARLAGHYLKLAKEEIEQEITERVGSHLGKITLAGKVFSYPLGLTVATQMTATRLALIGDAAHAIHPIAGQGINLGFRDVAALHDVLSRIKATGGDIGCQSVLAEYERWRRLDTFAMATVTDGLNRLFSNRSGVLKLARGLGLFGVSKMLPVKKFFMKHAMGTTGDLPMLMR